MTTSSPSVSKKVNWTWDKVSLIAFVRPFLKHNSPPEIYEEARKVWRKQLGLFLSLQLKTKKLSKIRFQRVHANAAGGVTAMLAVVLQVEGDNQKYGIVIGTDISERNIWHVYPLADVTIRSVTSETSI